MSNNSIGGSEPLAAAAGSRTIEQAVGDHDGSTLRPAELPGMYEQAPVGPLFRPSVEELPGYVELAPGDRLSDTMALIGMSPASKELSDAERGRMMAAIARDSAEVVRRHTDAQGFNYQTSSNITMAKN